MPRGGQSCQGGFEPRIPCAPPSGPSLSQCSPFLCHSDASTVVPTGHRHCCTMQKESPAAVGCDHPSCSASATVASHFILFFALAGQVQYEFHLQPMAGDLTQLALPDLPSLSSLQFVPGCMPCQVPCSPAEPHGGEGSLSPASPDLFLYNGGAGGCCDCGFSLASLLLTATSCTCGTSLGKMLPDTTHGLHPQSVLQHRSLHPHRLPEHRPSSRLGPKSQGSGRQLKTWLLWTLILFHLMSVTTATADARVEPAAHHRGSEASLFDSSCNNRAKQMSVLRYPFRPPRVGPPNIRKRALLRAIARAEASATRTTWYRGRQMDVTQLRGGGAGPVNSSTGRQPTVARSTLRHAPRLRVLSWNSGGLNSVKYKEVLVWLQCAHEAGQTYDICVLQETAWPHDSEFVAKVEGSDKLQWHAIHSAGKGHDGILCLVRAGLIPAENLRYQAWSSQAGLCTCDCFSVRLSTSCVCTNGPGTQGRRS